MKHLPWITFLVSALAILVQVSGSSAFEWHTDLFASGEPWRFVTGHLSHWSWDHLVWDVGMFLVLGCILESRNRVRFLATICITILFTDVLLRLSGNFEVYRGLSGIALGLFGLAMGELLLSRNRRLIALGGMGSILVVGKLGVELLSNKALFVDTVNSGFTVALEAHLAGVVAACCAYACRNLLLRKRSDRFRSLSGNVGFPR